MRFLRTTSTARLLALVIGVVVVGAATAAIAIAATGSSGQKPPPKPLAQAVRDALTAPKVDGVTARIKFTNHLIDSGAVVGQTPLISGASGRLWASSDGKVRLELQSTSGDVQVTSDGKSFLVYDSGSNTAYRGEIPQHQNHSQSQSKPDSPPSVSQIQKSIHQARQHGSVSGAIPTTVAGQSAYEVRVAPQHGGLVSGARLAWDAIRGVPLKVSVYARGNGSPVLSLGAQNISFGKVAASTFAISPPKGAHVVDLTPHSGGNGTGPRGKGATGLRAVQKAVGFTVSAPDRLAGKSRQDVKRVGSDGALVTYGQGLDGIAVFEKKSDSQAQAPSAHHGDNGLSLPTVSINGTTARELPTALGTVVQFTRGGVEYTVLGSQPANTVIAAARAL
jgi:outer membrane lipoprotein-sorting protein